MIPAIIFLGGLALGLMAGAFAAWWVLADTGHVSPDWD